MALYPDQAIFSKRPVRKLEDFKGLKTRVHSVALASLVAGLAGEPLTVAFAEVYTAMERGTLDAGISGTKPGLGLRWYEVSKYLVGPILCVPMWPWRLTRISGNDYPRTFRPSSRRKPRPSLKARLLKPSRCGTKRGWTRTSRKAWSISPSLQRCRHRLRKSCAPRSFSIGCGAP